MILLRKGICAPVAPPFKGQRGSAPVMHPVPASLYATASKRNGS